MAHAYCLHCETKMTAGVSFCSRCGHPTMWASNDERIGWELAQWRATSPSRQAVHTPAFAGARPAARPSVSPPPRVPRPEPVPLLPDGPLRVAPPPPRPQTAARRPEPATAVIDLTVSPPTTATETRDETTMLLGEIVDLLREVNARMDRLDERLDQTRAAVPWHRRLFRTR